MEDSSFGRLFGVLVSPVQTFRSIAERPTWLVAFLLLYILGSGVAVLTFQKVDFAAGMREQMEERGQKLPPGSEGSFVPMVKTMTIASAVVLAPGFYFLVAALFLLLNLVGGELDYRKSLAVTVHAYLPFALAALLTLPVALSRGAISFKEMQAGSLLHSNLGFLVAEADHPVAHALLGSCDLFVLWTVVLFILGYHIVARVSRKAAAATVLSLWLLVVALRVSAVLWALHVKAGA
jgi:hypothetical protein